MKAFTLFPGKNIIEICQATLGNWGARLILLPLLAFMFLHLVILSNYQTKEINAVLLSETPISATTLTFLGVSLYAAWNGISSIVRTGTALFIIFMPFVIFSLFICSVNFDYHNLFPLLDSHASFLFKSDFYVSFLAYSGFLFLGFLPMSKPIPFKKMLPAMVCVAIFAIMVVYVPLMVFGQEAVDNFQYPSLMASDTIDLEWVVFDWLPTFYVVATTAISTLQAAALLYVTITMIQKLYIPINKKWIAGGLFVVVYILSMRVANMKIQNGYFLINIPFCLYSIIIIPVIMIVLGSLGREKVTS